MSDLNVKVILKLVKDGFDSAVDSAKAKVNQFTDHIKSLVASFLSFFTTIPGMIASILGGAALTATVGITRQFQVLEASIKTVTKGLQDEAMPVLKAFAARTPFDVEQVVNAFVKLVNFGLDPSEAALESYGNTASALGKTLNQMVEAVADATTGEFERLKEFGIRASKQGDEIEFTFQGIKTTVGNNAKEIEAYLIAIGKNNFAGAMADRAKTLDGALSNLGDSWRNLLVTITSSGFDDVVAGFALRASDAFDGLSKIISSGVIQAGISTITTAFDGFARDISKTMALVTEIVLSSFGKWDDKGTSVARKLTTEFQAWLTNTRSLIQIATVEAASWWDKLLVTLDSSQNSMRTPFDAQQEQIDAINQARFDSISGIIDERDAQKQANNEALSAYDAITKALEREAEAHKLNQDALAKYQIGGNLNTVAQGENNLDSKAFEKINKAKLDSALAAIKAEEEAAKNAHDIALAQAEAEFKAKELQLKQLGLSETETQARSLVLANDLAAQKLKIETDYLKQSHDLEMKAIDEKIKAQQAALAQGGSGKSSGFTGAQATNSEAIITRLTSELQLSRAQAAGVVGNLFQESGLSSTAVNPTSGAFGIAQWLGSRKKELEQFAKSRGELISDFNTQVEFLIHELNGSEKRALNALRGTNDVPSATTTFRKAFERPGEAEANDTRRVNAAKSAFGSGSGDNTDQQAEVEQLKALQSQKLALVDNYHAKLKLLGIDAQNDKTALAGEELALASAQNAELNALLQQRAEAEAAASLDRITQKEADSQRELALGNINQEQHLANLQTFAQDRLAVEMAVLEKKRALLGNDKLALEKNLEDMKALWRKYQGDVKALNDNAVIEQQNQAKGLFAPFENAIDQSTNGILTGQQTIMNAARNAAQSVLVSYLSTSIKQRAIWLADWAFQASGISKLALFKEGTDAAGEKFDILLFAGRKLRKLGEWAFDSAGTLATEVRKRGAKLATVAFDNVLEIGKRARLAFSWAWEFAGETAQAARKRALKLAQAAWDNLLELGKKAKMAAFWVWDLVGFTGNETAKTVAKTTSEAAMTGVQVAGDAARTISTEAAEKASKEATADATMSKVLNFAVQAAGAVYASVSSIPYVGWILAPIAAAATFAGVMAFGAMASFAKKGELEVESDNAPYFLHKRESVLPERVADNFRKVVNIVDDVKAGFVGTSLANVDTAIKDLRQEGQFNARFSAPPQAFAIAGDSQETANLRAKNAREVEIDRIAAQRQSVVNQTTHHNQTHYSPVYHNNFVDTHGAKRFFDAHGDVMARKIQERTRKGAFGPVGVKNA